MSEKDTAQAYERMTVGRIVERVFHLWWDGRKTFVGIALVPPATFFVVLGIVFGGVILPFFARMPKNMSESQNFQMAILFFTSMSIVMVLCSFVFAPSFAAGCYAAVHADLGGRVIFKESYAFALQRYGRFLALFFAVMLIALGPMLILELLGLIPAISLRLHSGGIRTALLALIPIGMLGFMGVYVVSIILMLRLSLAFPASVTESLSVWSAVRRSSQLARRAKGRIFLVLLVVYAASYAVYLAGMVVAAVWFAILGVISFTLGRYLPNVLAVIVGILTAIGVLCMMMFCMACSSAGFSTALAVLYNDQRRVLNEAASDLGRMGAQV